ncbi:MAG: ABC transporter permease [Nitrospirae bacterium]|nr:ABC transporter permease [Nitrospirota bacterium]
MEIRESLTVAFEGLLSNKVRSSLTMLGVIIGVLAVILLVSIGEGARKYIARELEGLGSNILIITQGKTETSGSSMMMAATGTTNKLTYDDAKAIGRRSWAVKDSVPVVLGTSRVKFGNRGRDTTVIGVTPEFERVRNMYVEIGRFVDQTDVDTSRRVVVLGRVVKKELFGDANALGEIVVVGDSRYRVIGIMAHKGVTLGWDMDDVVFIPVTSGMELFDTDRLFEILVQVENENNMEVARRQIKDVLIKRHDNKEDFTITDQGAMLSAMTKIMGIMTAVLAGIAGISLLVGGIGIMNIMLVSVRERTREIGVRKAVGATSRDILVQFLIESLALSMVGGLIGILLAVGLAFGLSKFTSLPTSVSLWSIVLAFTFSAAVGVFFGVYPAVKASRLDPIEALRYE